MRTELLVLALVATPFFASAAQDQAGSIQDLGRCEVADANRSSTSWSNDQQANPTDPLGRDRTGCSPVAPGDPPPPPPPPASGTVTITGRVFNDISGRPGLQGWVVTVSGPASVSTTTGADGSYTLANLPAGTYLLCEVLQTGWTQTRPSFGASCGGTLGYSFTLGENQSASLEDFGNVVQ